MSIPSSIKKTVAPTECETSPPVKTMSKTLRRIITSVPSDVKSALGSGGPSSEGWVGTASSITEEGRSDCRRPLGVRFAPTCTLRYTTSRRDYTAGEVRACWLQEDEYGEIRSSCCWQIERLQSGDRREDGRRNCIRGLESQARLAAQRKVQIRQDAVGAVLSEQDDLCDVVDYGKKARSIASRYVAVSSICQLWAHAVGLKDEREAEACYAEGDPNLRRNTFGRPAPAVRNC